MEEAVEHAVHLASPPLDGFQRLYLEELATYITTKGAVYVDANDARTLMHTVAQRLNDAHQITSVPSPTDILTALHAHHVLERVEYPLSFRFSHQQFQELYAAADVKRRLLQVAARNRENERRDFTATYVNQPA